MNEDDLINEFMKDDGFLNWFDSINEFNSPIPKELHSVYSEGPFAKCDGCNKSLLSPPKFYEIQKVYRYGEVVFEYAICNQCGENLSREYSKESIENLQQHFFEHCQLFSLEKNCIICQKEQNKLKEYSSIGICKGDRLFYNLFICQECTDNIESLLSEKTKRIMGDFIDNKFPGVPEHLTPAPLLQI